MQKNLRALARGFYFLTKRSFRFFSAVLLVLMVLMIHGQEIEVSEIPEISEETEETPELSVNRREPVWYRSNSSGMALERIPSRAVALRNEYSLLVSQIPGDEIPDFLLVYYDPLFTAELRTLYENGEVSREQWHFLDRTGTIRLNASGDYSAGGRNFIEVYNDDHAMTEEWYFSPDNETHVVYTYSEGLLVKAESWIRDYPSRDEEEDEETLSVEEETGDTPAAEEEPDTAKQYPVFNIDNESPPDISDYYRYTRSYSLRAIERVYHSGFTGPPQSRIGFSGLGPNVFRESEPVSPVLVYSSAFLEDVIIPPEGRVIYSTDSRGRVLSEQRFDENGELIGEIQNTWTGDRLDSVYYKSGDDVRLTEYEYDDKGDRILERNFNRGALERIVRQVGDRELEELYMNGRLILRAVWEEGRKISEERIRNR